jgi:hypothetical protein
MQNGAAFNMDGIKVAQRLGRGKIRASRSRSLGTKLTIQEELELVRAAESEGKSASEWAREVLLRQARRAGDDPVFIELIATRMILLNLLKPLAMGQKVTPEDFTRISATVRSDKRKVAQEIQQQYTRPTTREE